MGGLAQAAARDALSRLRTPYEKRSLRGSAFCLREMGSLMSCTPSHAVAVQRPVLGLSLALFQLRRGRDAAHGASGIEGAIDVYKITMHFLLVPLGSPTRETLNGYEAARHGNTGGGLMGERDQASMSSSIRFSGPRTKATRF